MTGLTIFKINVNFTVIATLALIFKIDFIISCITEITDILLAFITICPPTIVGGESRILECFSFDSSRHNFLSILRMRLEFTFSDKRDDRHRDRNCRLGFPTKKIINNHLIS